jgi:hypothetical protein
MHYSIANASGQLTPLERAAPFLIAVVALIVSSLLVREIVARLEDFLMGDWTAEKLMMVEPDRAPQTYAQTVIWAIDAAQLPALIAIPVAAIIALRHTYTWVFALCYGTATATLLIMLWFVRGVNIFRYSFAGMTIFGYGITPVAVGGIVLNTLAALAAAFLVT